ncbi:MAG: hypothetical protein K2W95_05450 [Candidatus Obscuribacterales bacterium]|nr:hypothetical protein [Candidatus Obscuribacterales bacterium]
MIKVADPILITFIITSISGFFLRFIKDGVWKQLSVKPLMQRFPLFASIMLPFIGLFVVGQQFGVAAAAGLPYFGGAILLSYLLGALNLPSYLRGILLLAASVALTQFGAADANIIGLGSALTGLLAHKLIENLSFTPESSFDDALPPLIWLSTVMWVTSVHGVGDAAVMQASTVLGIISVSLALRFVQGPILGAKHNENLKRVMLSTTGGLFVLLVLLKGLAAVNYTNLAWLCGSGYLLTYLFKDVDVENRYSIPSHQAVKMLILVGILTVVATRFFGTFGLLALAPVAMVAPVTSAALIPGIFWASRALLQVFVQNYNTNVTGINLTHQYTGAAMYAGFLLAVVLTIFFREFKDRRVLLTIMTGTAIVVPVMSNFVLHAEPTCSLLVSTTVAAILMAVMAPSLLKDEVKGVENLALLPALMVGSGLTSSGLLTAGLESTIDVKTAVLSYGILFVLALTLGYWWMFQRGKKAPA